MNDLRWYGVEIHMDTYTQSPCKGKELNDSLHVLMENSTEKVGG